MTANVMANPASVAAWDSRTSRAGWVLIWLATSTSGRIRSVMAMATVASEKYIRRSRPRGVRRVWFEGLVSTSVTMSILGPCPR